MNEPPRSENRPLRSKGPTARRPFGTSLLVGLISLILVVVIALIVAAASKGPEKGMPDDGRGSPLATTPGAVGPSVSTGNGAPSVQTSSPGRIRPATDQWLALLPRLEAAVEAKPEDTVPKRKLAIAYYNLGRLSEAAALYEDMLEREEDPVLRNRLGSALRDMGRTGEAEAQYRAALTADPALATAYVNLAELLWRSGREQDALAVLDEGLASVPEDRRAALEEARKAIAP